MATRIIINDKEMTNPYEKGLLMFGAIIVAALVTATVIFVQLPIIGVAVTLTTSFVLIFITATLVSISTLALVAFITSWIFGAAAFAFDLLKLQSVIYSWYILKSGLQQYRGVNATLEHLSP